MERETKTTSGHCMQCKIALFPGLSFHRPFFDRFKFLHSVKTGGLGTTLLKIQSVLTSYSSSDP